MERHGDNAQQIAEFLAMNRSALGIEVVYYPGLPEHPGHEIAASQMTDFGAVVTMILVGGLPAADSVLQSTELFEFAVSLGGVESLIQHPASMTHASVPRDRREAIGLVDGLVRLSAGVEAVDDLILDLEQALTR